MDEMEKQRRWDTAQELYQAATTALGQQHFRACAGLALLCLLPSRVGGPFGPADWPMATCGYFTAMLSWAVGGAPFSSDGVGELIPTADGALRITARRPISCPRGTA